MSGTSTDPIADMLTRIRNAISVHKSEVDLPYSGVKLSIAQLLKANNFIDDVNVNGEGIAKSLTIRLNQDGEAARITEISRLSKLGNRQYIGVNKVPTIKHGRGIVIVSTPQGVMTGNEAKQKHIGGELICEVY